MSVARGDSGGPPWSRLLVATVAIAVYLNGLPGEFVYDDKLILRDPRINGETDFSQIFITDYWDEYPGTSRDLYRPLTIASYAWNRMAAGLDPAAFHVVNIALHAVVSVLVVSLVQALLADGLLAFTTGLLFAVHPVHTEAVTGIVGRAEVMSTLFLLLALLLQAREYRVLGAGPRVGLSLALLSYLCALGCKETAIVGPGLVAVVDYVQQRRQREGRWDWRRTLRLVALHTAVAALFVGVRYAVTDTFLQRPPQWEEGLLFGQSLPVRLSTAGAVLATYLRLLVFPRSLSADYSYRQVPILESPDLTAVIGLLAVVAIVGACVWANRRGAWTVVLATTFFLVAYSVAANFPIPLRVLVAERLLYLPSVGFCLGLAGLAVATGRRAGARRRVLTVAAVGVVVVLGSARTMVRNLDWRDAETLYAATVEASPECYAARFNYAAVLLDKNRSELALEQLHAAYALRRNHAPLFVNLAVANLRVGRPDVALDSAREGLTLQPHRSDPRLEALLAESALQMARDSEPSK